MLLLADIELRSARMGRRTVPMHNSGRAVVRFTGTQLDHWSALSPGTDRLRSSSDMIRPPVWLCHLVRAPGPK